MMCCRLITPVAKRRSGHPAFLQILNQSAPNAVISWFAMPLISPSSLHHQIVRHGALSGEDFCGFAKQLVDAVNYMHSKMILHMDIKPGNCMWRDGDKHCYLIDFGSSQSLPIRIKDSLHGNMCYTPGYRAIELWNAKDARGLIGHRTEAWAVGCTLFEAGCGMHLFRGRTVDEVRTKVFNFAYSRKAGFLWDRMTVFWRATVWKLTDTSPETRLKLCDCMQQRSLAAAIN